MRQKGERFNPHNLFYGVWIPEALLKLPVKRLSQGAKVAYGRLARYGGENGEVFPRRETLADEVGCSVRQVDAYLKQLKTFGLIEAERTGLGKPNKYFFVWHEIFEGATRNAIPKLRNTAGPVAGYGDSKTQNNAAPSIKESHTKRTKEEVTSLVSSKDIETLVGYYRERIDSVARLTSKAELVTREALSQFSLVELKAAVDGFAKDPWCMENQASYGMSWFFGNEDRVAKFISVSKKNRGPVSFVIS